MANPGTRIKRRIERIASIERPLGSAWAGHSCRTRSSRETSKPMAAARSTSLA